MFLCGAVVAQSFRCGFTLFHISSVLLCCGSGATQLQDRAPLKGCKDQAAKRNDGKSPITFAVIFMLFLTSAPLLSEKILLFKNDLCIYLTN